MGQHNHFGSMEAPSATGIYLDVDQAAAELKLTRGELIHLAELGIVQGHKLWHGKRFCWKFKKSELAPSSSGGSVESVELTIQ